MRRKLILLAVLVVLMTMAAASAHAGVTIYSGEPVERDVKVEVDGWDIEFAPGEGPVITEGRIFLPIRAISELLGNDVKWHPENHLVVINRGEIIFQIGEREFTVNGKRRMADVAPFVENGRTKIPLRYAAEALGIDVEWDGETRTASMKR